MCKSYNGYSWLNYDRYIVRVINIICLELWKSRDHGSKIPVLFTTYNERLHQY